VSRLIIDARWLYTGLGAYTGQLVRALHELADFPVALITLPEHRDRLASYSNNITLSNSRLYSVREQVDILHAARDYEVLHVPHYNVPLFRRRTLLVTIHDLNHLLDPTMGHTLKSRIYAWPMLRHVAERADHIFTQSEYSKHKIVEHLGVHPDKLTVTYTGVPTHIYAEPRDESRARTNQAFGFDANYMLFVGNLKPHKNVAGLLKAFSSLRQRGNIDHKLLIVGDDQQWRPVLLRQADELRLGGSVVFGGRVTDDQVRFAYSGADLTVVPSLEEGLGLPVLESMACGTPVACSDAASFPEVAGYAAEYFSPADTDSIARACENVLLKRERWLNMQAAGYRVAAKFHWRDCAARHISVYRKFLAET
jgi:glycosyltransferase involved in cell wall biosynthesis